MTLSDPFDYKDFNLKLTVEPNNPPFFLNVPEKQYPYPGLKFTYSLPIAHDIDDDPITISMIPGGPSFITYSTGILTVESLIS